MARHPNPRTSSSRKTRRDVRRNLRRPAHCRQNDNERLPRIPKLPGKRPDPGLQHAHERRRCRADQRRAQIQGASDEERTEHVFPRDERIVQGDRGAQTERRGNSAVRGRGLVHDLHEGGGRQVSHRYRQSDLRFREGE